MSALEMIDAVAQKTGEDSHEIRRRGFVLTGPEDSGSRFGEGVTPHSIGQKIRPREEGRNLP